MPVLLPETIYDIDANYHWQNANDRVAYEREMFGGTYEERTAAQALMTANPQTPNAEITANLDHPFIPAKYGYDTDQITIDDILAGPLTQNRGHVADYHTTDFSGRVSGRDCTEIPSLPLW
jgi:hypothetical protein